MSDRKMGVRKIISLCPSVTETICELGFPEKLAGITDFCVHPSKYVKQIPKIGGVKNPDIKKILRLKPDLVLFVKDENTLQDYEKLHTHLECIVFDIKTIDDSMNMIASLEKILNAGRTKSLINQMNKLIGKTIPKYPDKKYLYLVWKNPFMAAANNTYTSSLLSVFGMKNFLAHEEGYPEINLSEIDADTDYIFLPDEPWKFTAKDRHEISEIFPKSKVINVDGKLFSWFGYRTLITLQNIRKYL